jgi:hypothetical protein
MEDSNNMRPSLNAIRNAKTDEELQETWKKFRASYSNGADTLIAQLDRNWIVSTKLVKWAIYFREVGRRELECCLLSEANSMTSMRLVSNTLFFFLFLFSQG